MESFWLLPGSFLNRASTFVFNMLLGRITFVQIFYLTFSSMNIDNFSLKTTSAFLLHLESFCRRDGRRAFKFVGQAWFTKKGSSTIQSHGDWQLCFLSTTQTIKKSTTKTNKTGACDYITFCNNHSLSLQPTPLTLSRYIAYSSHSIASSPKYLTGASHFLKNSCRSCHSETSSLLISPLHVCSPQSSFSGIWWPSFHHHHVMHILWMPSHVRTQY